MHDWSAPVGGLYCERLDTSFWAEPANAWTNVAFLIAAAALALRHRDDRPALALAGIVGAIGVGSFLFHTVATRWAMVADVAPIQIFIATYFFLALRRFLGLGLPTATAGTLAFIAASAALPPLFPSGSWRGTAGYLGGLFGMLGVGLPLAWRRDARLRRAGSGLLAATGLFGASLVFRTLDRFACPFLAVGTHPFWHLTNAAVLFVLVETFAGARQAPRSGA